MIKLKHPHPNHTTAPAASADSLRLLWYWLQDHCDEGVHRLIDVYQIHSNGMAHNDAAGNLTGDDTTHTYDTAGNLATQTDARNKKTVYTYDALNRLTQTVFADATRITYQYDAGSNALGRLVKMTDPVGITQWTYDAQGRVITQTQTTGTLNQVLRYGYDASGRVAQLTYPSGKVISYGYDLAGNLAQLSLNGQPLLNTIRYQPYGAVKEWTWSNGTLHSRAFDQDGRIISHPQGGTTPLAISYDSAGRIVQQTQSTGVHSYGYDSVDRLTQHVDPTGLVSDYQYDRQRQLHSAHPRQRGYPLYPPGDQQPFNRAKRACDQELCL